MKAYHIPVHPSLPRVLDYMHDNAGEEVRTTVGGTQVSLEGCPFKSVATFLRSLPVEGKVSAWSVRLKKGGYHVMHNHPKGDLSGVYYLRTGPGADLTLGEERITPQPGMLLLFPSDMPHGTTPYEGEAVTRLTIAFDVKKEVS